MLDLCLPPCPSAADRPAEAPAGALRPRRPGRRGRAAARPRCSPPRRRSRRRTLGPARRPGGLSVSRPAGPSCRRRRRHRTRRCAPARLRGARPRRRVLVLADGLDPCGGRGTPLAALPVAAPPVAARAVPRTASETEPKGATKNPMHLDVRLEAGDDPDAIADGITERGGRELHPAWGVLPWRVYTDPSGNELCVLPARS